jgi:hypothetical protein
MKNTLSGLQITSGKGFHLTFKNGWTASVQFGYGNYCEHYDLVDNIGKIGSETLPWQSHDAEVARFPHDGELERLEDGDTVAGHLDADQVLAFLNKTAQKERQT